MDEHQNEDLPEVSGHFLSTLDRAASKRQQELAVQIQRRLAAGESVDDVRPLIERMTAVVAEEQRTGHPTGTHHDDAVALTEDSW